MINLKFHALINWHDFVLYYETICKFLLFEVIHIIGPYKTI